MYTAIDADGYRVFADDASKGEPFFCPACNAPMILRRGGILSAHFAHKGRKNCDLWQTGEMSDWHKKMQSLFPLKCQEIVVWDEDHEQCHIADVMVKQRTVATVFEFQHSQISRNEFVERSLFFLRQGYALVWVFDFQDKSDPKKIKRIYYTEKDQYEDCYYMRFIWPRNDRIRFLDGLGRSFASYELKDYEESGMFRIVFHLFTGLGNETEREDEDGHYWTKWEYADNIPIEYREHYFAVTKITHKSDIRDFEAICYGEDEFYDRLAAFGELDRQQGELS